MPVVYIDNQLFQINPKLYIQDIGKYGDYQARLAGLEFGKYNRSRSTKRSIKKRRFSKKVKKSKRSRKTKRSRKKRSSKKRSSKKRSSKKSRKFSKKIV